MSMPHHLRSLPYTDEMTEINLRLAEDILRGCNLDCVLLGPIADFGCGSGKFLHLLKQEYPGTFMAGVDLQPTKLYADVMYVKADMRASGLKANTMQLITSIAIADYLLLWPELHAEDIFIEVDRVLMIGSVYLPLDLDKELLLEPFHMAGYKRYGYCCQKQ